MAEPKAITFLLKGADHQIGLGGRVTKDDLYGGVKRVCEKVGRPLERGYLTPDGRLLKRSQMTLVTADDEGTPVEEPQMLRDGQPAELLESSFKRQVELTPVPMVRLVGFQARDAYWIEAPDLAAGLYETVFNYRASHDPKAALILKKENDEAWLLSGVFKRSTLVGLHPAYDFFDSAETEDEDDDALDFSMM